jgi:hypothetical protein
VHVAVTGSSGLIGSALVASLERDGHTVSRVVRNDDRAAAGTIRWDPPAGTVDAAAFDGVDAVVHLAGAGIGDARWTDERKRLVLESRTRGTALLSETVASLERRPTVLVSGSAVGYYGDRGDEVLTEDSAPGDLFLSEVCRRWEAATGAAEAAGVRVAHVRTGLVAARRGGFLGKLLPLFRLGLGGRMGRGDQWWSWITIDDEVGAIRHLIDHDVSGPVNLTAPQPVTNREFTSTLARVLRRPALVPVPSFGPKALLGAELAHELLFAGQRVEPRVLLDSGYRFRDPELEPALRRLLGR